MSLRRLAIVALAAPLLAGCWSDLITDETIGSRPDPAEGGMFRNYVALGTSIGAGIQSGGINDSTQREAYTYLLAVAMGLTPGVDWHYPSLTNPGCPPPYTNILTGTRVSTIACAYRNPASAWPFMNNVSVPSIRAAQVLNIGDLTYPNTDSLKLVQFITGSRNPIDMADAARPSFITLEIGANDVLGAATRGDALLLTPLASFQASFTAIAARLDSTGADVAVANVPNVTRIPHFTAAQVFWCLDTGLCPGTPQAPFAPLLTVDNSCAPSAPGVGAQYLLTFTATGAVMNTLGASRLVSINCATDQVLIATAAPPAAPTVPVGPTINAAEYASITARVTAMNAFIASEATARVWALANLDSALAANAAQIPAFPCFPGTSAACTSPNVLFGALFSQDGIHPNRAGHRIAATVFANAINAKFAATLTVP